MTPERATQVYEVFRAVLECDPSGRAARLDELCGGDAELRAEVERLLADDERASCDQFLEAPGSANLDAGAGRQSPFPFRGLEVHIRCPHCRNPIELIGLPAEEVVCPSCGSAFRLERESTAPWSPRGGQRRLGRFELIETVGVGAFGTVYKARDPQLDRVVAIKVPRAGSLTTDEDRGRFLREGRSVAQLRHGAIVPIHEVGEHEGVPYLVSDFVQGLTLSDLLTGRRPSPGEAVRLVAEVADALQYAHDRGVIHRDVKPSNLLLDDAGRPHVMDFGLAKRDAGEITMTLDGQVLGTPAYMSPEQAKGEGHRVDGRSDVYSLGVVLYELLTGELPFRGNTRMLLHQVLHDEPRSPRSLNDRIPRDLEIICLKAMSKERNGRYTTAKELAADLRRFLGGEPIQARPVGWLERYIRWARRNPMVAGLVAAVVIAVVGGLIGTTVGLINVLIAQGKEREQAELANRRLYVAKMNLVQRYWDDYDPWLFQLALDEQLPRRQGGIDRRGWEWYYWQRKISSGHIALGRHGSRAYCVAFSPDGTRLASASDDGWVKVWDTATGQEPLTLRGHTGEVHGVAFSPDGTRLASAGTDGTVKVWDTATGEQSLTLMGHTGEVNGVAFSPDGTRLASAGADGTKVWDTATGRETLALGGHTGEVNGVAFSPDGTRLASAGHDRWVRVWDSATGQETLTLMGHTGEVNGVAFSPDGTRLASAGADGTVKVWDTATGRETRTLRGLGFSTPYWAEHFWPSMMLHGVAFSPDGTRLAFAGTDGAVKLWDTATGQATLTLRGHAGKVNGVAFSPDGTRLASAGHDRWVRVWDSATGQEPLTLRGHAGNVHGVAFSPDGTRLASAGHDRWVRVWDSATGQETLTLMGHTGEVHGVAFSPDGTRLASAGTDGTVKVWDTATGRETLALRRHTGEVHGVAFSPDGTRLASAGTDGTVKLWNPATGQETLTLRGLGGGMFGVAFSPDGTRLAAADLLGAVKLWDTATGQETLTLRAHGFSTPYWAEHFPLSWTLHGVAFSPDGTRLASAGADGTVKVWDTATGRETLTLRGHAEEVHGVAFSPDGTRLASAGTDGAVKLWDTATGQETLTLRRLGGGMLVVVFSPDGTRLASAGTDGTVKVWDCTPITRESIARDDALRLIRFLLERVTSEVELRDCIMGDKTVSQETRATALRLVNVAWAMWIRRQAESLVSASFDRLVLRADVLDSVRTDPALKPEVREAALGLIETWPESADTLDFHAWLLLQGADCPKAKARRGLRLAEAAVRIEPAAGAYLSTLGAAQYRAAQYEKALLTLARSNRLNENGQPADLAFLAMTQHRLKQAEAARETLARLRELMKDPEIAIKLTPAPHNWHIQELLREAEALIELDPVFPADPFAS